MILDHFETALHSFIHNPHDTIGDVNLVPENERKRLLADINHDGLLSPAQNVSELIEAQTNRTPQKIAVSVFRRLLFSIHP